MFVNENFAHLMPLVCMR